MTTLFHSATAVDARGEVPDAWVLVDGDSIVAVGAGRERPRADTSLDLSGRWITPGFVDLHMHGGGGHDIGTGDISAAVAVHRAHGTTRTLLSLVANPTSVLRARLGEIAALTSSDPLILGAHLEGPFLAPSRRGAHAASMLRAPTPEAVDDLIGTADGALRQITIAPELPGGLEAVRRFANAGVVVAVGHTEADAGVARAAFDAGARLLTHAFNAMPGIHHRAPGPIVAAFDDDRVTLELVLDGIHVDASVARIAALSAPGRLAFVTDAMSAAGAPDGCYRLGTLDIEVAHGGATVRGSTTIAGSTLTQDVALAMAISGVGMSRSAAVEALTLTPARVLGVQDRLGLLAPAYAADIVVFDHLSVVEVWADGRRIAR